VYEVAAGLLAGKEKATDAAALLYGLDVPTSVAAPIVGLFGCKKSFADSENLPACFDIFYSPLSFNY
jgi:hypothetical protein